MYYGTIKFLKWMGLFFACIVLRTVFISIKIISILSDVLSFKIPLWFKLIEIIEEFLDEYIEDIEKFLDQEMKGKRR